VFYVRIVYWP